MKKPPFSLLVLLSIAPFVAGGCTLYSNPSACEAQMRQTLGAATPAGKLSVSHVGVGIGGSRVVVEGAIKSAAAAPVGASAPAAPVVKATAAECTFDGDKLTSLHWLAPDELANPPAPAATTD